MTHNDKINPDGEVYAGPRCKNCGLPIQRERHRAAFDPEQLRSRSGWTHGGHMRDDWQGIRCPGRLCGAKHADG